MSYRHHPYDIQQPRPARKGDQYTPIRDSVSSQKRKSTGDGRGFDLEQAVEATAQLTHRRRGYLSNLIDLYNTAGEEDENEYETEKREATIQATRRASKLIDPLAYNSEWELLDRDDPIVTGVKKGNLEDIDDIEKNARQQLTYKERRKEKHRIRIEYNLSSIEARQNFLMTFARALLSFGAPSHRMESQLLSAARILEVDAEFTHMPGLIIASFGDEETKTSQMHFAKCGGRLSLGNIHRLHSIYRAVVHDEISAKKATEELDKMLAKGPMLRVPYRLMLSFLIAGLICPIAFGGSLVDMFLAGGGSLFLTCIQTYIASRRSVLYANVYEILSVIVISFVARGLSSIRSQIFCYASVSSAAVVTILPGFLILTSSLDLASKNILCGSIKMVYALIYTLFLGFGLQFGSDLFLLFDPSARHELDTLAARAAAAITVTGTYIADPNATIPQKLARIGSFTFTPSTPFTRQNIVQGCYRPSSFPWYLQRYPWWAQFIIVPVFSVLSSLNNEQPINWDLLVMVVISCASYAANKVADHFIFHRSDVVSAIGAFVVGFLGNVYSRKMGGTAFTSMVTGVLFLVPSGLSEAGGITAQNSATEIGTAMVTVTIGITVGLFISQALVYLFGNRKNAATFSF
ncbi:threonine/serine exporter family protein [Phanerochaete sordida]|uniref:Threonine/serine exporter family protein n=1 Tax=Phanerochaete sordida TaxID=48140 RepID=A0A9P3GIJ4_9APHY|nr:threonine/serine exporter family protein [Phanerochaete sordida]